MKGQCYGRLRAGAQNELSVGLLGLLASEF